MARRLTNSWPSCIQSGAWEKRRTSSMRSCSWRAPPSSPARSCMSTAARAPATDSAPAPAAAQDWKIARHRYQRWQRSKLIIFHHPSAGLTHVHVEHEYRSSSRGNIPSSQGGRPCLAVCCSGLVRVAGRAWAGALCLHTIDPRIDRREVVQPRGRRLSGGRQSGRLSRRRADRTRTRRTTGLGSRFARNDGSRFALLFYLLGAGLVHLVLWLAIP